MQFLLQGYEMDPVAILKSAMFKEDYRQMVIVKDIEIFFNVRTPCFTLYWKSPCLHIFLMATSLG